MDDGTSAHYRMVAKAIVEGRVVPLLGAGVNLCGRPKEASWQPGVYAPSGRELATHLADDYGYPPDEARDLVRISEYVAVSAGSGELYLELRKLFDADYPPTALHQLLAELPGILRGRGSPTPYQLIVTTNYDDILERAFQAAGEPFDLIWYMAQGEEQGKFWHRPPDGEARLINEPNVYDELRRDQRSVILKMHGAVDRVNPKRDSYVITEDDYIEYLTRTQIENLVPLHVRAAFLESHFLFLGYSLSDWNLRVILHRIWGEQTLSWKSWAVQLAPPEIDQKFWGERGVEILDMRLEEYVVALRERLCALPAGGGSGA
jgi:hypothetical protein